MGDRLDREAARTLHTAQMIDTFNRMRQEEVLTDFVVRCGDQEFEAHRIVLSAGCCFFQALFETNFKEVRSGRVELEMVDKETMHIVLDFIYAGHVGNVDDDVEMVAKVLAGSHFLQIPHLIRYYADVLEGKLTADYFVEPWLLGVLYDDKLADACVNLVVRHFLEIISSREFFELDVNLLKLLLSNVDLIAKYDLEDIVKSISLWVSSDRGKRVKHSQELLSLINLEGITAPSARRLLKLDLVKNTPHVRNSISSRLIDDVDTNSVGNTLVCFGVEVNRFPVVTVFSMETHEWSAPSILPFPLHTGMAVAKYDGHFYFLGGGTMHFPASTVYRYNLSDNSATQVRNLTYGVIEAGAGVMHDSIYLVTGGQQNGLKRAMRYYPRTGNTFSIAPTNLYHVRPKLFPFMGRLYCSSSVSITAVEEYDILFNRWTVLTQLPGVSYFYSVSLAHNEIYMINRMPGDRLGVYDLASRVWTTVSFTGGPQVVDGIWTCQSSYDQSTLIVVSGRDNVLYLYDQPSGNFKTISTENPNPWNRLLTVFT